MQVYYFTRTGRSKHIAEELAAREKTEARRIEDGKNWSGAMGYLKAGAMSVRGKGLPAVYEQADGKAGEQDVVVVVFPLWAGTFPPAVRTFIEEVGREHVVAIPTSLGSTLKDRQGFINVVDLVGKDIQAPVEI